MGPTPTRQQQREWTVAAMAAERAKIFRNPRLRGLIPGVAAGYLSASLALSLGLALPGPPSPMPGASWASLTQRIQTAVMMSRKP